MLNLTWKFNPDNSDRSEAEVGDRVHLQADDAWQYTVRADALAIDGRVVTAVVVDVFDRATGMPVNGGEVTSIIGKTIVFESGNVFEVIKKLPG